jgi:hypothetical protein
MEVPVMKKYNTPEMKVSMFNEESVVTVSDTLATYDYYVQNTNGVQTFEKSWEDLSITF